MPDSGLTFSRSETGIEIFAGDVSIATYVFEPNAPNAESPKPFLHPLRSVSGAPLSVYRPWDHRWHKGLQMTLSEVSGENFWGGPSFTPIDGYVWKNNLGTILHREFRSVAGDGLSVTLGESLDWIAANGENWFAEARVQRFHSLDVARGLWAFDFETALTNVSGRELVLGSPTTLGRESAGYTGLFWRGPRSWTGATVTAAGFPDGSDVMGESADWLALTSQHDECDGGATVLAIAGTSSASAPIKWFVRSEPFAAIAPSPAFDTEVSLSPGGALSLRHRFVFIDHVASAGDLAALGMEFAL